MHPQANKQETYNTTALNKHHGIKIILYVDNSGTLEKLLFDSITFWEQGGC